MDLLRTLIELERQFWDAAGDRDRYATRLAADAVHVFPGWGIADREPVLAGVEGATPWETVTIDDARVVPLSEDAAAIVYHAHAKRADEEVYRAAITSVYRRDDGDWELVLHQQTPFPAS